ncbi:hypothetical protein EDD86DRAFT_208857 [Gorgonomyces haynaldii]|nr:hypothetical protein EDD86DRAFT_208857 [Gorgonomyces haynaldii]
MSIWLSASLSGLFSGIVASLASVAIERFGGAVGGVLGSSPTTLIPASIGFWITYREDNILSFQKSMLIVCPGMLVNAVFLTCWRVGPKILTRIPSLEQNHIRLLLAMTAFSYFFWFVAAAILVLILEQIVQPAESMDPMTVVYDPRQNVIFYLAVVSLVVQIGWGLFGTFHIKPTPKADKKTGFLMNVCRGIAAGVAIFLCILLGKINPLLGGIFSLFPAIFGTAMISVWLLSGSQVSLGSIEPLILGSSSVSMFAFISAFLVPLMNTFDGGWIAAYIGVYLICIFGVSVPIYFYLTWRQSKYKEQSVEPSSE